MSIVFGAGDSKNNGLYHNTCFADVPGFRIGTTLPIFH